MTGYVLQRIGQAVLVLWAAYTVTFAILYLLPGLHDAQFLGVPLPIWLVVVPPFPLFFCIGLLEQRRADGLDEAFRDLVEDP